MSNLVPVCTGTLSFPDNIPACDVAWTVMDVSQIIKESIDSLISVLNQLFSFDLDLFELVLISMLLTWVTGHILGRMMQAWRKVQ